MTDRRQDELTEEETEGTQLPDREAMALIDANVAAPVNAAVAANALSSDSTAIANAEQDADISQSSGDGAGLVDANVAAPVNLGAALNVLSDDSVAYANAQQDATIDQD
jgi:hypothetical protein